MEHLANELCQRGWRTPALVALEAGRPFAFIGGQLLWILQPLLGLVLSLDKIGQFARVLENPSSLNKLICQLEEAEVGERD